MKKYICITMLFATIVAAQALLLNRFTSWDDLIERSPDIIIARCIATQDLLTPKPTIFYGNVFNSDIKVISVLKGGTKPGMSHMVSLYLPHRGEYFLVLGNYFTYQTNSGYSATEEYRVIPLIHYHGTNELAGKTLNEQIQLILNNRLNDLNEELARDNEEKARLEAGLMKGNKGTATSGDTPNPVSTNAPPAVPQIPRHATEF